MSLLLLFQLPPRAAAVADTIPPITAAITAKVLVKATVSETIAPVTTSITGQVVVKATLSETIAPVTTSITGQVLVKATLSETIAPITLAATDADIDKAVLAATMPGLTLAASDQVVDNARVAATLPPITLATLGPAVPASQPIDVGPGGHLRPIPPPILVIRRRRQASAALRMPPFGCTATAEVTDIAAIKASLGAVPVIGIAAGLSVLPEPEVVFTAALPTPMLRAVASTVVAARTTAPIAKLTCSASGTVREDDEAVLLTLLLAA